MIRAVVLLAVLLLAGCACGRTFCDKFAGVQEQRVAAL